MIRARGVTFGFPGRTVLEDLTIDIEESLTTVIVGRSGIGKSTLVRRFVHGLGDAVFVLEGRCFERERTIW